MSHYSNISSDFFFNSQNGLINEYEVSMFSQFIPEQMEKNEYSKTHYYTNRGQNSKNSNNINNNSNFTIYPFIDCNNSIILRKDFSFHSELEKNSKILSFNFPTSNSKNNNNSSLLKNKSFFQNEKDYKVIKIKDDKYKQGNFSYIQKYIIKYYNIFSEKTLQKIKENFNISPKKAKKNKVNTLKFFTENLTKFNTNAEIYSNESTNILQIKPIEKTNSIQVKCKCQKSKCLKNYCECFSKGQLCKEGCQCLDCSNTQTSIDKIVKAKQLIYIKSKKNTNPSVLSSELFCKCSKSHCQKKYCECYNVGKPCGNKCKCCECKNIEQNDSIYKISNKLNEKNYTNHKRQRNTKIIKNKFVIDKNIVNMINKFKILKSSKTNASKSISTNSETNQI